jgi:hypothetical protein
MMNPNGAGGGRMMLADEIEELVLRKPGLTEVTWP